MQRAGRRRVFVVLMVGPSQTGVGGIAGTAAAVGALAPTDGATIDETLVASIFTHCGFRFAAGFKAGLAPPDDRRLFLALCPWFVLAFGPLRHSPNM